MPEGLSRSRMGGKSFESSMTPEQFKAATKRETAPEQPKDVLEAMRARRNEDEEAITPLKTSRPEIARNDKKSMEAAQLERLKALALESFGEDEDDNQQVA